MALTATELLFGEPSADNASSQVAQRVINKIQDLDADGLLNERVLQALLQLLEAFETEGQKD